MKFPSVFLMNIFGAQASAKPALPAAPQSDARSVPPQKLVTVMPRVSVEPHDLNGPTRRR